jgi:hypothetical protein
MLEHMGVDQGGFDILVAQKLLHHTNIAAVLEKVGGNKEAWRSKSVHRSFNG